MILLVNKTTEQMVMGEQAQQPEENTVILKDIVVIAIVPGQRGMQPLPHPYPGMFSKNFVKEKVLFEREYTFKLDEWSLFTEDDLTEEAIQMYRSVMAERSGIVMATNIPKDARIING